LPACTVVAQIYDQVVSARSSHGDVVHVAMGDASTRSFSAAIDVGVWRNLSTGDGLEVLPNY
jgi:hypothetical protein